VKLRSLVLENVRGVPDGMYSFDDARTGALLDVVIVTGGPGSGKTSLLEAIATAKEAVGSYGNPPDPRRVLRRGAARGRIGATWVLSEEERTSAGLDRPEQVTEWDLGTGSPRADVDPALRRLFAAYSRDPARGKVEYFPANRSLAAQFGPRLSEDAEVRLRLGTDPGKYGGLLSRLRDLARADAGRLAEMARTRGVVLRRDLPDSLGSFREMLATLVPGLRLDSVDLEDDGAVRFVRRDRRPVELVELSECERQGVLVALAFWGFGLSQSLVLLDEPELHMHASERVRSLQALVALGRDNQIIVATGSTEIVQAATRAQVVDLSSRIEAPVNPE
jgi:energy-coupling factor transporter ATP-binding protein EcfA2